LKEWRRKVSMKRRTIEGKRYWVTRKRLK